MKGSQHGGLDQGRIVPDTFAGLLHDGQGTATIDACQITPFQQKIGMGRTIRLLLVVRTIEKIIKTSFQPTILIFNKITSPEKIPLKGFGLFGIDGELGITAHKFTQGLPIGKSFVELTQRGHQIQHRTGTLTDERLSKTTSCFLGSNQEGELLFDGRAFVRFRDHQLRGHRGLLSVREGLRDNLLPFHLWFALLGFLCGLLSLSLTGLLTEQFGRQRDRLQTTGQPLHGVGIHQGVGLLDQGIRFDDHTTAKGQRAGGIRMDRDPAIDRVPFAIGTGTGEFLLPTFPHRLDTSQSLVSLRGSEIAEMAKGSTQSFRITVRHSRVDPGDMLIDRQAPVFFPATGHDLIVHVLDGIGFDVRVGFLCRLFLQSISLLGDLNHGDGVLNGFPLFRGKGHLALIRLLQHRPASLRRDGTGLGRGCTNHILRGLDVRDLTSPFHSRTHRRITCDLRHNRLIIINGLIFSTVLCQTTLGFFEVFSEQFALLVHFREEEQGTRELCFHRGVRVHNHACRILQKRNTVFPDIFFDICKIIIRFRAEAFHVSVGHSDGIGDAVTKRICTDLGTDVFRDRLDHGVGGFGHCTHVFCDRSSSGLDVFIRYAGTCLVLCLKGFSTGTQGRGSRAKGCTGDVRCLNGTCGQTAQDGSLDSLVPDTF